MLVNVAVGEMLIGTNTLPAAIDGRLTLRDVSSASAGGDCRRSTLTSTQSHRHSVVMAAVQPQGWSCSLLSMLSSSPVC